MNDRIGTGMAKATRLTRAGQLTAATAVIQRMLRGIVAPDASSHTAEPVDVPFHVFDADPLPTDGSTQAANRQSDTRTVFKLPAPDVAVSTHERESAFPNRTDTRSDPSGEHLSEASAPVLHARGGERAESTPSVPEWATRLHATLRSPRSGLGIPASSPMLDRARSDIWAGGQFLDGSYTSQVGTRTYKLYIPNGYRGQALPLVVMLHGCTQTPEDFAAGTRMNVLAERELFLVVYPAQAITANPSKCWNWFKASDQHRDHGEPSILAGITRQIMSTYHVDAQRVYVVGLSAGGAMAAIMGMNYPDLYAAIGVHSGLAYGAAYDLPSALAAMQHGGPTAAQPRDSRFPAAGTGARVVPTIVFHGDGDTTVHPCNGDQVLAQWATIQRGGGPDNVAGSDLRVTVSRARAPDGHAYTRSIYHEANGQAVMEQWLVHGAGHGWSGGSPNGSFTDPRGPDASQEMVRFFRTHRQFLYY
ncbi:MAG: extracellular catalytic domain type 1 short-chain-length polyhydroxyalkanoate depolymerase [Gammaproteobacteria bacterium]